MTTVTLLSNSNAAGAGATQTWPGGVGVFAASGKLDGGSVKLQFLGPDGVTWIDAGPDTMLRAPGAGVFTLPAGASIRAFSAPAPGVAVGFYATAGTLT